MSVYICALTYCLKFLYFVTITVMLISDLLQIEKGITAVIGGGGKTTLLHTLAKELSVKGTVVITTTTHILKSEVFHNVLTKSEENLSYIGEQINHHRCICLGSEFCGEKLGAPDISLSELCSVCDYVLVEADGSKHLPLKAHLSHEPVIPENNNQTILVIGVDAVGKSLKDTTHRFERASELLSCSACDEVTPLVVATLLNKENLHDKVVINKCDTDKLKLIAEQISSNINTECVISSLHKGEWYVSSN